MATRTRPPAMPPSAKLRQDKYAEQNLLTEFVTHRKTTTGSTRKTLLSDGDGSEPLSTFLLAAENADLAAVYGADDASDEDTDIDDELAVNGARGAAANGSLDAADELNDYDDDEEEQEMSDYDEIGTLDSELDGTNSTVASTQNGDQIDTISLEKALERLKFSEAENDHRESGVLIKSPIVSSMFDDGDAVLYFPHEGESIRELPREFLNVMLWKVCKFTPKVVRNALRRTGFKLIKGGRNWIGHWGKHFPVEKFKTIQPWQKVNHFPMSFEIGRKDRMFINVTRMRERVGAKSVDFLPQSFILPHQRRNLRNVFNENPIWIVKPPASARGLGIKLISRWSDLPKKRDAIVSRYITNPFLIDRKKFDLRLYVAVTSFDPLRIYLFKEGIVRFAAESYNESNHPAKLKKRGVHLTNYSIARKSKLVREGAAAPKPERLETELDEKFSTTSCKWGLDTLREYFSLCGIDFRPVLERIKALIIKTIISVNTVNSSGVRLCVANSASCYELFGFDVLLDESLKPWLMEVNISPSLKASCDMDYGIKSRLVTDLFNLVGIRIKDLEMSRKTKMRENWKRPGLSGTERKKHREHYRSAAYNCLAELTADDMRVLKEHEDEARRKGNFERLYPSRDSGEYLDKKYTSVSYYDRLLQQWTLRTYDDPAAAINLLRGLPILSYGAENGGGSDVVRPSEFQRPKNDSFAMNDSSSSAGSLMSAVHTRLTPSAIKFGAPRTHVRPPPLSSVGASLRTSVTTLVASGETPGTPSAERPVSRVPSFVDRLYYQGGSKRNGGKGKILSDASSAAAIPPQQPRVQFTPSVMNLGPYDSLESASDTMRGTIDQSLTVTKLKPGAQSPAASYRTQMNSASESRPRPADPRDIDDIVDRLLLSSKSSSYLHTPKTPQPEEFPKAKDVSQPELNQLDANLIPGQGRESQPVLPLARTHLQFNPGRTLRGPEPGEIATILTKAARLRSINHAFSTMRRTLHPAPPNPAGIGTGMNGYGYGYGYSNDPNQLMVMADDPSIFQAAVGPDVLFAAADPNINYDAVYLGDAEIQDALETFNQMHGAREEWSSGRVAKDREVDGAAEPLFPSWKTDRRYGRRIRDSKVRREERAVVAVSQAAAESVHPIQKMNSTVQYASDDIDRVTPWVRSVPTLTGGRVPL